MSSQPGPLSELQSAIDFHEPIAIAADLIEVWGKKAAMTAADQAAAMEQLGDKERAARWREVMLMVMELRKL